MTNIINKSLIAVFIILMMVSALLLYQGYRNVGQTHIQAKAVIHEQQTKFRLLTIMHSAARERSLILLEMLAEDDPFKLDDKNQELGEQARVFITARSELVTIPLSEQEKSLLIEQNKLTQANAPIQDQVAELFLENQRTEARELLLGKAIPNQELILDKITEVLKIYESNTVKIVAGIDQNFEKSSRNFQILGFALLATIALFILFTFHVSRREHRRLTLQLDEQKRITTQLDRSAERLSYQASHDGLTELINRQEFEIRLTQLLQRAEGGKTHVVFYLDLDQFKIVNDTCGHNAGDELLREISAVMQNYIRKSDVLARLGGDEFGIILEYCELNLAENVAQSIIQAIDDYRFRWDNKTFRIGVSIGMVLIDDRKNDLEDILKQIDSACFAAKDAGRGRYHLYREGDKELVQRETDMDWVGRLQSALEDERFMLYAQPIVPINGNSGSNRIINYEILIRMRTVEGEIISPGAFLPAAERYNKMINIDRWVVAQALSMFAANPDFMKQVGYCSINLSTNSLTDTSFLNFIIDQFTMYEGMAAKICFEITETAAIINLLQANRYINILRGMGLRFALDDFGSGLSSFGYLKTLPVDYLKIDGMFVKDIVTDPIDRAMVKSIHEIGSLMGKQTVAEYVEDDDILDQLRKIGVHYAQGFGVGRPVPLDEVIEKHAATPSKVIVFPAKA